MPSRSKFTVVLESGLAGSPLAWLPVAQSLEPDFRVAIHRRGGSRNLLPQIAQDLHAALHRSGMPAPYILLGHSFGALVIRQFAVLYPEKTAATLFVDGLPVDMQVPWANLLKALTAVSLGQALASIGLIGPALAIAKDRTRAVAWAFQELNKLPEDHR